jgi:hypothetical protein
VLVQSIHLGIDLDNYTQAELLCKQCPCSEDS